MSFCLHAYQASGPAYTSVQATLTPILFCAPLPHVQTTPTSGWPSTRWAPTAPSTTCTSRPTTWLVRRTCKCNLNVNTCSPPDTPCRHVCSSRARCAQGSATHSTRPSRANRASPHPPTPPAAPFAMERAPTAPLDLPALERAAAAATQGGAEDDCKPCDAAPAAASISGAPSKARRRPGGVRIDRLLEYPVRTLVFEAGDSLAEVRAVGRLGNPPTGWGPGSCRRAVVCLLGCRQEERACLARLMGGSWAAGLLDPRPCAFFEPPASCLEGGTVILLHTSSPSEHMATRPRRTPAAGRAGGHRLPAADGRQRAAQPVHRRLRRPRLPLPQLLCGEEGPGPDPRG